jgi:hypothetical protein
MATRPLEYPERRSTKRQAADKIAQLVEDSMTKMGLSEAEKEKRVKKFSNRVSRARSSKQQ